jgi:amidase
VAAEAGGKVSELLAALRSGEVSALQVVAEHLAALRKLDERTHAVMAFEDARALADASRLDLAFAAGEVTGPLHGLPVTVKDWIDVAGFPCAGESAAHRERRPRTDATVVARLRGAGAVVVAKTVAWGPKAGARRVLHPADPGRSPGGSSTGEAVAVASGVSPLGIGSDSGGSIRLPAAWCGAYGLKPTAGLVPTTGHFPRVGAMSDGRTQIGPLARCVDDLELALATISGTDWRDGGVAPVPFRPAGPAALDGARYAVVMGEERWWPTTELVRAVEHAAATLRAAGLTPAAWPAPWLGQALDITRRYWSRTALTGADAERQLSDWDRFRRHYLEAAEHIDFLLTPASLDVAPRHRESTGDDFLFTLPASLTGSPAVTIPASRDADGLPLAVQIIGRPWEDHRLLAAARLLASG